MLHKRMIKPDFWTDMDLIELLSVEGRLFYLGLIQLVDDSGCIEYNPLQFKIQLFPADTDITVEKIQSWTKSLLSGGKLSTYLAEDKACLFVNAFHKHQSIRNAAKPTTPLPPWIEFQQYESNPWQGKYIVSRHSVDPDLVESYSKIVLSREALRECLALSRPRLESAIRSGQFRSSQVKCTNVLSTKTQTNTTADGKSQQKAEETDHSDSKATAMPTQSGSNADATHYVSRIQKKLPAEHNPGKMSAIIGFGKSGGGDMADELVLDACSQSQTKDRPADYCLWILRKWEREGIKTVHDLDVAQGRASPIETYVPDPDILELARRDN